MSIFEYDKELEEKKLRKAEYEAGFSEGEKAWYRTKFYRNCQAHASITGVLTRKNLSRSQVCPLTK